MITVCHIISNQEQEECYIFSSRSSDEIEALYRACQKQGIQHIDRRLWLWRDQLVICPYLEEAEKKRYIAALYAQYPKEKYSDIVVKAL